MSSQRTQAGSHTYSAGDQCTLSPKGMCLKLSLPDGMGKSDVRNTRSAAGSSCDGAAVRGLFGCELYRTAATVTSMTNFQVNSLLSLTRPCQKGSRPSQDRTDLPGGKSWSFWMSLLGRCWCLKASGLSGLRPSRFRLPHLKQLKEGIPGSQQLITRKPMDEF